MCVSIAQRGAEVVGVWQTVPIATTVRRSSPCQATRSGFDNPFQSSQKERNCGEEQNECEKKQNKSKHNCHYRIYNSKREKHARYCDDDEQLPQRELLRPVTSVGGLFVVGCHACILRAPGPGGCPCTIVVPQAMTTAAIEVITINAQRARTIS